MRFQKKQLRSTATARSSTRGPWSAWWKSMMPETSSPSKNRLLVCQSPCSAVRGSSAEHRPQAIERRAVGVVDRGVPGPPRQVTGDRRAGGRRARQGRPTDADARGRSARRTPPAAAVPPGASTRRRRAAGPASARRMRRGRRCGRAPRCRRRRRRRCRLRRLRSRTRGRSMSTTSRRRAAGTPRSARWLVRRCCQRSCSMSRPSGGWRLRMNSSPSARQSATANSHRRWALTISTGRPQTCCASAGVMGPKCRSSRPMEPPR